MLDWIQNKVIIRTNVANSIRILQSVAGKDTVFDFNKIIPMPPELSIEFCSLGELGHAIVTENHDALRTAFLTYQLNGHRPTSIDEMIEWVNAFNPEVIQLGHQYQDNIDKFGFATWYQWNIHHWGTKWNASEGTVFLDESGIRFTFFTAWAPPHRALAALSKLWPDIDIENQYSQPGSEDTPMGGAFYRNGDIIEY